MSGAARAVLAVVSFAAVVIGGLLLANLVFTTERDVEARTEGGAVERIVVEADNAGIDVTAGGAAEVSTSGTVRESLRKVTFDQRLDGTTLLVTVRCSRFWIGPCGADLSLSAPADIPVAIETGNGDVTVDGTRQTVDVATSNGYIAVDGVTGAVTAESDNGDVSVRRVRGAVRVETDNGDVELDGIDGAVSVESDNGRVEGTGLESARVDVETSNGAVSLAVLTRPAHIAIETDNGNVELRLPDEGAYAVETSTDNGRVEVGVRTDPAADARIMVATDNGDIAVTHG